MHFRTVKERLLQSLLYEFTGVSLATVAYLAAFGGSAFAAVSTMLALSMAFVVYAPGFNFVFDKIEWRLTRIVASDRPHRSRLLHAILLEGSDFFLSVPILMAMGGHSLAEAILTDLGLFVLHAGYAYVFFLMFDRLRPVGGKRPAIAAQ